MLDLHTFYVGSGHNEQLLASSVVTVTATVKALICLLIPVNG